MNAFLQCASYDEQASDAQAVGQYNYNGPLQRQCIANKNTQKNKAQMADTAVGYQPFHIFLAERENRTIQNSDYSKDFCRL